MSVRIIPDSVTWGGIRISLIDCRHFGAVGVVAGGVSIGGDGQSGAGAIGQIADGPDTGAAVVRAHAGGVADIGIAGWECIGHFQTREGREQRRRLSRDFWQDNGHQ